MGGFSRETGLPLQDDWEHVKQSLDVIFTTPKGSRIMRRWFGGFLPRLLGRLAVKPTIGQFYMAIAIDCEQEPRFLLRKIEGGVNTIDSFRAGDLKLTLVGDYRPRALQGDFSVEGLRSYTVSFAGVEA